MNIAVILAAGVGSRLRSEVKKPKGFIEVSGETLIERSITILNYLGISEILIGTGYRSSHYEKLRDKYAHIKCIKNPDYSNSGSFYTLYNLRDFINDDIIILESDIIYEKRAVKSLIESKSRDAVLVSQFTNSGDEVFVQDDTKLVKLSKTKKDLNRVCGEFVGITKLSYSTYKEICSWADKNIEKAKNIHYEDSFFLGLDRPKLDIIKINDLIWAEIDTKEHYERVMRYIAPKIYKNE